MNKPIINQTLTAKEAKQWNDKNATCSKSSSALAIEHDTNTKTQHIQHGYSYVKHPAMVAEAHASWCPVVPGDGHLSHSYSIISYTVRVNHIDASIEWTHTVRIMGCPSNTLFNNVKPVTHFVAVSVPFLSPWVSTERYSSLGSCKKSCLKGVHSAFGLLICSSHFQEHIRRWMQTFGSSAKRLYPCFFLTNWKIPYISLSIFPICLNTY